MLLSDGCLLRVYVTLLVYYCVPIVVCFDMKEWPLLIDAWYVYKYFTAGKFGVELNYIVSEFYLASLHFDLLELKSLFVYYSILMCQYFVFPSNFMRYIYCWLCNRIMNIKCSCVVCR